jgi:sugar phosphate isomerase/epimerase
MPADAAVARGQVTPEAVSIATSFDYTLPIEQQLALVAEAGFTHVSLGARVAHADYLSATGRRRLRRLVARHGLGLDTIHGPRADAPDAVATLMAVIGGAGELDVPVVVAHGGPFDFPAAELGARLEALVRTCEQLRPILDQENVRLALENVLPGPATELVARAVEALDPALFGFCYDSAHDQIGGPRPLDLLVRLRGRLSAVQLSDRSRDFVDHQLPGDGFVDWAGVCAQLRLARFARPLLLEVATTHSAEKEPRRFLRRAHEQAVTLARAIAPSAIPGLT